MTPMPESAAAFANALSSAPLSRLRAEEIVQQRFHTLDDSIPTEGEAPLLQAFIDQHREKPLKGVTALLIQHQLGNHFLQARALIDLGLDPENIIWLDVPYTSNAPVRAALANLGIPAQNLTPHHYKLLQPYAPYQLRRTQAIYKRLLANPPSRLLVLDDGAYFIEAMSTMKARLPHVAVVEQTTRGLIKMEESATLQACARTIPIINVARSKPKINLEPPFIGRAVCSALTRRLASFPDSLSGPALVLGFGAIGYRVAESLANSMNHDRGLLFIQDPDPARQQQALRAGFKLWDRQDLSTRFSLVIGCSGRASFTIGDIPYLKDNAVLASASSGSVELSRQDFIDLADTSDLDDITVIRDRLDESDIHSDIRFQFVDRQATFLNGGFPINFDGRVNCVPVRYIQPTVTMMVAAAIQAVSSTGKFLCDLDPAFCSRLDADFRKELGEESPILD